MVQKEWIAQGYEAQGLEGIDEEDQLESGYEINGLKATYSKQQESGY